MMVRMTMMMTTMMMQLLLMMSFELRDVSGEAKQMLAFSVFQIKRDLGQDMFLLN